MLPVASAAVALLAVPGLRRCIALAGGRAADPRLLAAAAFAAAVLIAWRASGPLHGAALALTAAAGIVAGWVDAQRRRLPDALILPAYPAVGVLLLATGEAEAMLRAAACAAVSAAVLLVGHLAGQVGFGDVKLAGLLGLVLGWSAWQTAALGLAAASIIGAAQALAVVALGRRDFPYGPALLLGGMAALAIPPGIWALILYHRYGQN